MIKNNGRNEIKYENRKNYIKNETGLHARPASEIVKIASKYQSTIFNCKWKNN